MVFYFSESKIIHLGGEASRNTDISFSILLTYESLGKLIKKYHGSIGKIFFKCVVFVGSIIRLLLLGLLILIYSSSYKGKYLKSIKKYFLMIKWSLGIEKPIMKKIIQIIK